MGPGGSSRTRDGLRTARVGEIPTFSDGTNPRLYRRLVFEWIRFQDLADEGSKHKLSFGQQIYAIVTNIRGSAGHRLGQVTEMVRAGMTRDEFAEVVDIILDVVDPLDREAAFLETAGAWRDIMAKSHTGGKQSFDKYWSEFSTLCVQYAYAHGEAAQTAGVQELLALLCVLNARLGRAEFNMVLQSSMEHQARLNSRSEEGPGSPRLTGRVGPQSAAQAMSQRADVGAIGSEQSFGGQDAPAEGSGAPATRETNPMSSLLSELQAKVGLIETRAAEASFLLESGAPTPEEVSEIQGKVASVSTIIRTAGTDITRATALAAEIQSHHGTRTRVVARAAMQKDPILSMESVRVSLRRLDFGDGALASPSLSKMSDAPPKVTTVPMTVKCWVCEGPHYASSNATCKAAWNLKKKKAAAAKAAEQKKSAAATALRHAGRADRGGKKGKQTMGLLSPVWAEPPDAAESLLGGIEARSMLGIECDSRAEAIIDGGAGLSVVGIGNYVAICEDQGVKAQVLPTQKQDASGHAFGTKHNRSRIDEIVGRCDVPIPVGKGRYIFAHALVVDAKMPLIIGKRTLREWKCLESHDGDWLDVDVDGARMRLSTTLNDADGHSRLRISGEDMMMNVAESMLSDKQRDVSGIIEEIHRRTHLPPPTVELLLRRAKLWSTGLRKEIHAVHLRCSSCLRSGDPRPAKKFSLSKLHLNFNQRVCIDVLYWASTTVLHIVDAATGYSEVAQIDSRDLTKMLRVVYNIWFLRHGDPVEIMADAEFDKGVMRDWAKEKGVKLAILPARRHNKAGTVERKNRVIKDVLERLDNDDARRQLSFSDKLHEAVYASNLLYGGRVASSFEMARGYTPSIAGIGTVPLPRSVREAHDEMAKILRARPEAKKRDDINDGDTVLILVPGGPRKRGKWQEATVHSIRADGTVVCGKGRKKRAIAAEDVRTIPASQLARNVVRAQMQLPSEMMVSSDEAQDSDTDATADSDTSDSSMSSHKPSKHMTDVPSRSPSLVSPSEVAEDKANSENESVKSYSAQVPSRSGSKTSTGSTNAELEAQIATENVDDTARSRYGRVIRPPARYSAMTNPLDRSERRQLVLEDVARHFSNSQFMAHEAGWIPGWVYAEAEQSELDANWLPNICVTATDDVPHRSNCISSHFVYKAKVDEKLAALGIEALTLKARLCVHGNRDTERESMRSDAAVVSHIGFRLLYSVAACHGFLLGKADIRGAYSQSGDAMRDIYVIPPRRLGRYDEVWLLTKTMYGIVSAGRKWQRASDAVIGRELELKSLLGVPQLFYRFLSDGSDKLALLLAKYVDDLVIAGRNSEWNEFACAGVATAFDISSWKCTPHELSVNSTAVNQVHDCIQVDILKYSKEVVPIMLPPGRRKQVKESLTDMEIRHVRALSGKLGYLGITVSPFASFASSFIQQLVPGMEVGDLKRANGIARDVLRKEPALTFLQPSKAEYQDMRIVVFADAGFPHSGQLKAVAQEGALVGASFGTGVGAIFHLIAWQSRKQRRVAVSSGEAETIAALAAFGYGTYVRDALQRLCKRKLPLTLVVDSKGLHRSLATQSTPRDVAMLPDVDKLRVAYESGDIDAIVWITGIMNPADALTKPHSGETAALLERMMTEGRLPVGVDNLRQYGPALEEEG